MNATVVETARTFAIAAHSAIGQARKYTGYPYWHHPEAVARLVWQTTGSHCATAAAWLHDVLEDTKVTRETLEGLFHPAIVDLVVAVTDVSRPEDGNRRARKAIDRAFLAGATPLAQTIKVADLIDNTSTIIVYDPSFARVYMQEKRELLEVLTKADPGLLEQANEIISSYERTI